jgi:hypothetical protein
MRKPQVRLSYGVKEAAAELSASVVSHDMLVQGTPQGDVEDLLAPADAKHRHAQVEGPLQRLDLHPLQLGVGGVEHLGRLLAVEGRAAGAECSAESAHHLPMLSRTCQIDLRSQPAS